jgi:hypothetical protein
MAAHFDLLFFTIRPIRTCLRTTTPMGLLSKTLKTMNRQRWLALGLIGTALILGSIAAAATTAANPAAKSTVPVAQPADPSKVIGNDACIKCHAPEQAVWSKTPHAKTFDELHRRPEAKEIARKLGIESIKHSGRCVNCHYTQQTVNTVGSNMAAGVHAIAGISCESCHGPARDWLETHHNYGGPDVTRLTETPEHRKQRVEAAIALGMRNPNNVYLVAQSCYRCHTTADEELVNVGGHSAGSLTFDFVSWSQGTIHHNFVESDGKVNIPSSPERLRVMFVAGILAEVESTMRAVAKATTKENYGVTVAQRAARSGARLKSVAAKVNDPRLDKAVKIFETVSIKLNNEAQLTKGADMIAKIGIDFAENPPASGLEQIERFVPTKDKWK